MIDIVKILIVNLGEEKKYLLTTPLNKLSAADLAALKKLLNKY